MKNDDLMWLVRGSIIEEVLLTLQTKNYVSVDEAMKNNEIFVGKMNEWEKAIYSVLEKLKSETGGLLIKKSFGKTSAKEDADIIVNEKNIAALDYLLAVSVIKRFPGKNFLALRKKGKIVDCGAEMEKPTKVQTEAYILKVNKTYGPVLN